MLFLVLWAIVQVCQAGQLIIDNEWPGGFQGHFDMTPNKDIHGWKITLVFDQPLESLEVSGILSFSVRVQFEKY